MSLKRDEPTEKLTARPDLAPPPENASLLVLTGSSAGRLFELEHPSLMLGRSEQAQIPLVDRGVSREHALITRNVRGYFVQDLGSTNGTWICGRAVQEQKLLPGDELHLGPLVTVKFGFRLGPEQARVERRAELGRRLESALKRRELKVVYQPIVHLSTREVVGLEALPRWNDIPPSEFLPAAQTGGVIDELDRFVLSTALEDLGRFKGQGLKVFVSVNLSAREALDPEIGDAFLAALGANAGDLVLDVPGSACSADENVKTFLARAAGQRARLALQDFGVDHASLEELGQFKFSQLKLARKFVHGCPGNRESMRICVGGIRLAESLGARSVAVGIETFEQYDYLAKNDCILGQGHFFSPPLAAERVEAVVTRGTPGGEILPCA